MLNLTPTTKNLAPRTHENTKPYKRIVEYEEKSTRNPKNAFQKYFRSLIAKDA